MKIEITARQVQYMESTAGNLEGFKRLWERFHPLEGLYTEELYQIIKELDDAGVITVEQDNHPKLVAYYNKYFPKKTSSVQFYQSYLALVIAYNFYKERGARVCGLFDQYRLADDKYCLLINKTLEELKKEAEF